MGTLVAVAVIAAGCWMVSLWRWPYAPCRRCAGKGTNPGSNRKRFGQCKRCKGTRSRQRLGAYVFHRALRAARQKRK